MPILKKRPDDFTGVEVIVDDKPLYIQAKDTPMELAETFKSGIKNEYDRLIIGNQELFISIRDIINSVVVKNFEKWDDPHIIHTFYVSGYKNSQLVFTHAHTCINELELLAISSSMIANIAYFVSSCLLDYDEVIIYGHKVERFRGSFRLDNTNNFSSLFNFSGLFNEYDVNMHNILLIGKSGYDGTVFSYEIQDEFNYEKLYLAFRGKIILLKNGVLLITKDRYLIPFNLTTEYQQYLGLGGRYKRLNLVDLNDIDQSKFEILFEKILNIWE